MQVRPLTPDALVTVLADRLATTGRVGWLRVAVDGAPPTRPDALADALVGPLRVHGRAALRVRGGDFLRPASVRLERGRQDPDSLLEDWLDSSALRREVLDPLAPDGSGRYLPSLWDSARDRATRAPYVVAPPGAVLLLDGAFLLGRELAFDVSVHLSMSVAALARRTPADDAWTLPAYERYAAEIGPVQRADLVVRVDDPLRPALVTHG